MRLFVAILIPEVVRKNLSEAKEELRKEIRGVKWVEMENMHLTVKFLGEVDPDRAEILKRSVQSIVAGFVAMPVHVAGLGAFPSLTSPRVIWVGLEEPTGQLRNLAHQVDQACTQGNFGEPEDRPWASHLTLGRVRKGERVKYLDEVLGKIEESDFGDFVITELALMQSTLTPKGPIYERLADFPLQGSRN